jgi:hypothetical protein
VGEQPKGCECITARPKRTVAAARAAGMRVYAYTGLTLVTKLMAADPTGTIAALPELLGIIGSINAGA